MLAASATLCLSVIFSCKGFCEEDAHQQPIGEAIIKEDTSLDQNKRLFQGLGIAMFAATAGDAASTEWGLTQPGTYEKNPLMTNREVRIAAHVVAPTVAWWTTDWMRKQWHPRSALLVRIGMTAGYTCLTIHNLRSAQR